MCTFILFTFSDFPNPNAIIEKRKNVKNANEIEMLMTDPRGTWYMYRDSAQ